MLIIKLEPGQDLFKRHNKPLTPCPKPPTLVVKRCSTERTECPPIAGSGYRPWLGFAVGTALTERQVETDLRYGADGVPLHREF
jgi:hypothetical protein